MIDLSNLEAWFVTGSQHLYGPETLKKVEQHATAIVRAVSASPKMPVKIVAKPVMTNGESIHRLCQDANSSGNCVGLITWMHTFSPARMWIAGLGSLNKPLMHLHTQFNDELPWSTIDMDFMNLNQSAHGDREFGFIGARCGSGERSLSATGRMRRFIGKSALGYAQPAPGTMRNN
jgi:L-arabinose isomerase